jgi:hypothetical protein
VVEGIGHLNGIEGFWGNMKRGIDGAHHVISPKHLQRYVDETATRRPVLRLEGTNWVGVMTVVA